MKKTIAALLTTGLLIAGVQTTALAKSAARAKKTLAGPQWDRTITMTADGFPVMGNPAAPVKVVEFISYTCSHCAEFSKEAKVPLSDGLVRQGKVSVELRPYIRTPLDPVPSLLALCGTKDQYFANSAALLAAQDSWFKAPADPGYQARWQKLDSKPGEQRVMVAQDMGLYKLMLARGYTAAALNACLNDQAKLDWLNKQTDFARTTIGVTGTPSFLINGVLQDVYGWSELAPRINSAVGVSKAPAKM